MSATRSLRATLTVMMVAVVALALSATAAFAQEYPPSEDFGVSCVDAVEPGDPVNCSVVGAVPGETLTATAEYNPVFYTEVMIADENGRADFSFTAPPEAEGQIIIVRVVGSISGEAADTVEVVEDDDADDPATDPGEAVPAPAPRLPLTGGQVLLLTSVGIALLGGGLLMLRRREDTRVTATA